MRRIFFAILMLLAMPLLALGESHCNMHADKAQEYWAAPGDGVSAHSLSFTRAYTGHGNFELNVCRGTVRVEVVPNMLQMRVKVELRNGGAHANAIASVRTFQVTPDHAVLAFDFRKQDDAVVTIELPMLQGSHNQINVGAGQFEMKAARSAGDREINIGAGSLLLMLNEDRDYHVLETNVGLGSFKDERAGGSSHYFVVSKEMQGHGDGRIQINVGAGSAVIRNQ